MYGLWPRLSFARERRDAAVIYRDLRDGFGMMDGGTFWEVLSQDSRSNAHGFTAYAGTLLFEGLTGIRPSRKEGYRHVLIDPQVDETVDWARGHLETEQGTIGVAWQWDSDYFSLTIGLPKGATAEVRLPPAGLMIGLRGGHSIEGNGCYRIDTTTSFAVSLLNGLVIETKGMVTESDPNNFVGLM